MRFFLIMLLALASAGANGQSFARKRYDSLIVTYNRGTLPFNEMRWMIAKAEQFGRHEQAKELANTYTSWLMDKIDSIGYRKDDIELVMKHTRSFDDPGFRLFFEKPEKMDAVLGRPGASKDLVDYVIAREEIDVHLWKELIPIVAIPDWKGYEKNITKKYGKGYADKPILGAKVRWYQSQKDDKNYIRYQLEFLERYGMEKEGYKALMWNNFLFKEVFKKSADPGQLNLALGLAKQLLDRNPVSPSIMDTYANLLYKLGRKDEAIEWQQKAQLLDPKDRSLAKVLELMKSDKLTW